MFKRHFMDGEWRTLDFKCEEDWKAAIYAWGGPKPSLISRVKVDFNKERLEFLVMYLEKSHEQSQQGESDGEETLDANPGGAEASQEDATGS